jgi:hypothetical protein
MTVPSASLPEGLKEARLPRRDWIVLPLVSLLTVCLLAGATELIATWVYPRYRGNVENCLVLDDPSSGARGIPNCKCWGNAQEGPRVEYKFNACGHRAGADCGYKQPGTYRIVEVGASQAFGYGVANESTLAELLPLQLSRQLGRKVEIYNESMARYGYPHVVSRRFKEALAAHPDMILWMLTPHDIADQPLTFGNPEMPKPIEQTVQSSGKPSGLFPKAWGILKAEFVNKPLPDAIREISDRTRSVLLLRVLLYENRKRYVKNFLMGGGDAEYLRSVSTAETDTHLRQFDSDAAEVAKQAAAEGIPVVAFFVPNRAEAAMISMGEWPAGFDPYRLGEQLRDIITRHGGIYIDILPDYRYLPNPEQGYYRVDGHLNADGNVMISNMLAKELTNGAIPALSATAHTKLVFEKGK